MTDIICSIYEVANELDDPIVDALADSEDLDTITPLDVVIGSVTGDIDLDCIDGMTDDEIIDIMIQDQ